MGNNWKWDDSLDEAMSREEVDRIHASHGYGKCPNCGGATINCTVADDVCLNDDCGHVGAYYTGTIYG